MSCALVEVGCVRPLLPQLASKYTRNRIQVCGVSLYFVVGREKYSSFAQTFTDDKPAAIRLPKIAFRSAADSGPRATCSSVILRRRVYQSLLFSIGSKSSLDRLARKFLIFKLHHWQRTMPTHQRQKRSHFHPTQQKMALFHFPSVSVGLSKAGKTIYRIRCLKKLAFESQGSLLYPFPNPAAHRG